MRISMFVLIAALTASTVHAQTTPPASSGPLVLERIHNGWVLAPDFKVTGLDDRTGQLAGAYGGLLLDNTLLIGGAGYWLANDARDFKLAYGGLTVGWQSPEMHRIRFDGRGLVGFGRATLGFDTAVFGGPQPFDGRSNRGDIRFGAPSPTVRGGAPAPVVGQTRSVRAIGRDDFFVFEPQAGLSARVAKGIGVSCGVGYRATAETDVLRDRVNGPTANIAIQFGF